MEDSFDPFDSKRPFNSFGLPVGHIYFLACLPQGDLPYLNHFHQMPPLQLLLPHEYLLFLHGGHFYFANTQMIQNK